MILNCACLAISRGAASGRAVVRVERGRGREGGRKG